MSYTLCGVKYEDNDKVDDLGEGNEGSDDDDDDDDKKEENDREGCRTRSGNTRTMIKEFGQG